jgi:hypothetical protein
VEAPVMGVLTAVLALAMIVAFLLVLDARLGR